MERGYLERVASFVALGVVRFKLALAEKKVPVKLSAGVLALVELLEAIIRLDKLIVGKN